MRKRTDDNSRFATVYPTELILSSINKALETASVQPAEVAEVAGCSVRYAKDRLSEMARDGIIDSKIVGNVRVYSLKK